MRCTPASTPTAVENAARQGATLVSLVPTALRRIDPSLFRVIVLGGAAPPEALPPNVVTTYGLTETGSGVVYDGRPLDGVEVAVDEDDGSILLKGPMLLRAYRDGTDPRVDGGWLPTGDIGELDADGRLVVHGRHGDLIITGGENVWPDPVERVLATVSGVADVAVAAHDDPEWGQRVVAFVVPDAEGPPTLDALRSAVKDALAAHAAPRELVFVDSIPRTALGKVRRGALPRLSSLRQMSGRIEGKVAVITGGASGIGLGIARRFVAEGANVVLGDINEGALKAAADELGAAASTRAADVTSEGDLEALCAHAVELHGRLDIGVNAAGIGAYSPVVDQDVETWDTVMAINVRGVMLSVKHEARQMIAAGSGGSIINIASLNAIQPAEGMGVYCAGKAAVACTRRSRRWSSGRSASASTRSHPGWSTPRSPPF